MSSYARTPDAVIMTRSLLDSASLLSVGSVGSGLCVWEGVNRIRTRWEEGFWGNLYLYGTRCLYIDRRHSEAYCSQAPEGEGAYRIGIDRQGFG